MKTNYRCVLTFSRGLKILSFHVVVSLGTSKQICQKCTCGACWACGACGACRACRACEACGVRSMQSKSLFFLNECANFRPCHCISSLISKKPVSSLHAKFHGRHKSFLPGLHAPKVCFQFDTFL